GLVHRQPGLDRSAAARSRPAGRDQRPGQHAGGLAGSGRRLPARRAVGRAAHGPGLAARAAGQRRRPVPGPRISRSRDRAGQPRRAQHQMGRHPDLREASMRRQLRWYGASPLHLLALLACFGLAGYAAARLVSSRPLAVAAWFIGAVVGHDLLLMPLYALADRSVMAAIRHRDPRLPVAPWINYVRVPAALSGLLLLVWFPLVLRLPSPYHASTTLSADPYVWHWLAVTGALFLLSAVAFALRLRGRPRTARPGPRRPEAG